MVFGAFPHPQSNSNLFAGLSSARTQPTAMHICGLYFVDPSLPSYVFGRRRYLPTLSQSVHARIIASTSRTTLTQAFVNPIPDAAIPELRYTFPLYDGVSVVAFTCTINNDRVIHGVVQEKNTARKTYNQAVARGETAGLLEQLPDASDVFTTTIGNVPPGANIAVEIVYLGELKHDAEVDGIRFTIPTSIAPRYGSYPGQLMEKPTNVAAKDGINIVVDAEVPAGSIIRSIQSPSHPIAVTVGSTSTMKTDDTPSLQLASATLSLGTAELEKDFIIQVIATNTSNPVAVLETHPTIPHQQALMATLVPKFKIASTKPEVVFVIDRSGSMEGKKMMDLREALKVFMKSLPVGAMFNICSFGSRHSFLFTKSKTYDQDTLQSAMKHIEGVSANFGGTEIYAPLEETFKRRHKDLDLEVFVLTDGEVWNHDRLFDMVNKHVEGSKGAIRVFTLGVGTNASHALVEGLARAGNGFSQSVSENEKMSGKVVRMLKGALTPHVNDYSLELKYADAESETEPEDDFEIVEPDSTSQRDSPKNDAPKAPISLFDTSANSDTEMTDAEPKEDGTGTNRFSHVPTVKPPKVLQAPFQIPPLYPYSRTSVYLLLSPDRELRNKTPESLILRGTSSQGTLELQIPITVLPAKSETIHQLAARKAVKELEEGRGWIFHAKAKDGEALKAKHPGRFPSMVEREAVRLGIQFQVGGKWCSFVAVEDNVQDSNEDRPVEDAHAEAVTSDRTRSKRKVAARKQDSNPNDLKMISDTYRSPAPFTGSLFGSKPAAAGTGFGAPPGGGMFASAASFGAKAMGVFGSKPANASPAFGGGLFGSSAPAARASGAPSAGGLFGSGPTTTAESYRPPSGGGLFGSKPAGPATAFGAPSVGGLFGSSSTTTGQQGLFGDGSDGMINFSDEEYHEEPPIVQACALAAPVAPVDESLLAVYQHEMTDAAALPLTDLSDDDDDLEPYVPAPKSIARKAPEKGPRSGGSRGGRPSSRMQAEEGESELAKGSQIDRFSALVSLQNFSGFWKWSDKLFVILGVTGLDIKAALDTTGVKEQNIASTAAVIAFLRGKLMDERDSWEMMEEKAVAWLAEELGDEKADEVLAALKGLF
ncbi:hypothetical protein EsH8_III_000198 [Colletotrichum jinshuiense]